MPYPLGVSFGPTFTTAAQASDDGQTVPIAKAESSDVYQAFFKQNLDESMQSNFDTLSDENLAGQDYPITNQKKLYLKT